MKADLIWEKPCVIPQGDCLIWTGAIGSSGYPNVGFGMKTWGGHRLAFFQATGVHPEKRHVCHTCDTPSCVNPKHLWLGTALSNSQDKVAKKRHNNQKKTHCKYGHEFTPINTIHEPCRPLRRLCRACEFARAKRRWANRA